MGQRLCCLLFQLCASYPSATHQYPSDVRHVADAGETAGIWIRKRRREGEVPSCIVPYLQYGPNNQYLQLMEAAVVARALGRPLLVPAFQAWVNDETGSSGSLVPFEDTFDVQAVEAYVAVMPMSKLLSKDVKEQTVIMASDLKKERMAAYLAQQGCPCCPRKRRAKVRSLSSSREIKAFVEGQGLAEVQVLGWYSFFVMSRELTLEAARHFLRAPKIRRLAQEAASSLFGKESFLAVHLRREATDLGCKRGYPSVLCSKPGREWSVGTEEVAAQISRLQRRLGLRFAYIATISPAQHPRWVDELSTLLKLPGAKSLSSGESMSAALHMKPGELTRYEQSLIEQELCATASGFLGSDRSTWTGNVELQREANGLTSYFFGRV